MLLLLTILLTCDVLSAAALNQKVEAVHLRCDHLQNPLGIDDPHPQFSWQMQDQRRGAKQTAYQIIVGTSADVAGSGRGDVWDSGKVTTSQSTNVDYGGPILGSAKRYFWAVRIWDADGEPSAISEPSWWEMGLLSKTDWTAKWIHRPDPEQEADRKAGVKWIWTPGENANVAVPPGKRYFRYKLSVAEIPRSAQLLVAGKDSMEAFVNGTKAGTSDTWGTFDVIDIGNRLKAGDNLISVTVTTSGTGGLAALLKLTKQDGSMERFPTDERWEASQDVDNGFVPAQVIAELGPKPIADPWPPQPASYFRKEFAAHGQIAAARLYVTSLGSYRAYLNGKRVGNDLLTPGWTDYSRRIQYQTYDVTQLIEDGGNVLSAVVGDGWYASGIGWKMQRYLFGPPPLRLLAQLVVTYASGQQETIGSDETWRTGTGPILNDEIYAGETYDARKKVDDGASSSAVVDREPEGELVAQLDQPIRAAETLQPKAVTTPAKGVYVFDLGQNISGWARLRVKGAAGTAVRLRFAEILKPDGNIYTENLRAAKATDTYILSGKGEETYEPTFTYHGFRYVELTGYPGKPRQNTIEGIAIHSSLPETGSFESSSALLNHIWRNILWGQRDNFMSIPTDCPQRDERLGWMADAQIFWRTASYNMNMEAFADKWLADVRDAQSAAGAYSDVSPRVVDTADGAPGWGDAGVIVPWITWQQYGDLRVVRKNWDAMKAWLAFIGRANPNFVWEATRGNDFGDWVPAGSTTPKDLIATAFWAYDAKLMEQMARALGKDSEAAEYRHLYEQIKSAFIQKFVVDGNVGNGSQTCDVLALFIGLLPDDMRAPVAEHLRQDIASRGGHLSTGFVGTAFLMPALSNNGDNDVAYQLMLNDTYPSWGYMVRKGATTMWERWNGDTGDPAMNSYNHYAFGAVGQWLYQNVAGIAADPDSPGYQKIVIHPRPDEKLTRAHADYDSPYGRISSGWTLKEGGAIDLKLNIPANTTATVYLPAGEHDHITESGKPIGNDVSAEGREGDSAKFQIGAGSYQFEVSK